jgi:hypothetical protein
VSGWTIRQHYTMGDDLGNIATSEGMRDALADLIKEAKTYAESISPVRSGDYAKSFKARVVKRGRGRKRRFHAILENTSAHALAVEFRDRNGKHPHRVMGRTQAHMRAKGSS